MGHPKQLHDENRLLYVADVIGDMGRLSSDSSHANVSTAAPGAGGALTSPLSKEWPLEICLNLEDLSFRGLRDHE